MNVGTIVMNKHYLGAYHSVAELEKYLRVSNCRQPFYALVARSNAGKSSLINALLKTNSAHVSQTPGKTQAAQLFQSPHGYLLIDLPGYGFARAGNRQDMDRILLECLGLKYSYSTAAGMSQGLQVIRLVDGNRALNYPRFVEKDYKLLDYLHTNKLPYTTVITKMDAMKSAEVTKLRALLPKLEYQWYVSSKSREGVSALNALLATGKSITQDSV